SPGRTRRTPSSTVQRRHHKDQNEKQDASECDHDGPETEPPLIDTVKRHPHGTMTTSLSVNRTVVLGIPVVASVCRLLRAWKGIVIICAPSPLIPTAASPNFTRGK